MKRAQAVPIPTRLQNRPKWHDLPIPYIAFIKQDGDPDFRVIDAFKRASVIQHRVCQLCGERLGRHIFFTGSEPSADKFLYYEPPTHLLCLLYAMQVCPFILGKMEHAPIPKVQEANPNVLITTDLSYTAHRNEWWVIVRATNYIVGYNEDLTTLLNATGVQIRTPKLHAETMGPSEWAIIEKYLSLGIPMKDR